MITFAKSSVFNNKPEVNTTAIKSTSDENDVTQAYIEAMITLEEAYYDINKDHYQATHLSMLESNVEILTEGLGDFMHSVVEFFKKLLERFKEFMGKVFMFIQAYIGDFDKFLSKYKDELSKLDPDFTIHGYEYSFSSSVPNIDKIKNVVDDYNNELNELDKKSKLDIIKEKEEFASTAWFDRARAIVLGSNGEIDEADFVEEAKKVYRSGENEEIEINVNKAYLSKVITGYPALKKLYGETAKERDKVIQLVDNLKNFFQKGASIYYKGTDKKVGMKQISINNGSSLVIKGDTIERAHNIKTVEIVNTFYNYKFAQAKEIGNICVTAMIEKANAVKEALKLHRAIVRKSLTSKKKTDGKEDN